MNAATFLYRVIPTVILICVACPAYGENPSPVTEAEAAKIEKRKARLLHRFTHSIYPMLTRGGEKSCVGCHKSEENSSLVLVGNAKDDFHLLLQNNYFNPRQPDSLLARVTHKKASVRMPEEGKPWSPRDIRVLRSFVASLKGYEKMDRLADERFPEALLTPYKGDAAGGKDNQFLTYRQLRGKIRTIFKDEWVRNGRDLFQENLALFGGADFKKRFNESSEPTSSFLTALNMMAFDVSSRACSQATGPFAGRTEELVPPDRMDQVDDDYRNEIARLYKAILFRSPSDQEIAQSFELLKSVYGSKLEIESGDYELAFELTVTDPASGLKESRKVRIPVSGEYGGVYQELLDQTAGIATREGDGLLVRQPLRRGFSFLPGQPGRVVIHNDQTAGNVSFAGIELTFRGEKPKRIPADDPSIQPDGAWNLKKDHGFPSYEDGNNEKGRSRIIIPLKIEKPGPYEINMLWRKNPRNASQVLVEVFSAEKASEVARPPLPPMPPPGEAHFTYDCSEDTKPYVEFDPIFQFAEENFVEVSNKKTLNLVTIGAVGLIPTDEAAKAFIIDSKRAEGVEKWSRFDAGRFRAYNAKGTLVHDGEEKDTKKKKPDLFLKFRPMMLSRPENAWKPESFYKVRIHYPGKNGHESRVPVIVDAMQSSPVIRISHPARAKADTTVELDASASYTVQHSGLKFSWKQLEGPRVKMNTEGPRMKFIAPRRSLRQAAWVALAQALVRHPDFLFTRPPSQWKLTDPADRKRLQLVKIALDLVCRAPNQEELERLEAGTSLHEFVDTYLASEEFRDFYFHRIRLYLESQGTELQDEPVRLWCYVAFNDLPFQQILTADFTVDKNMKKQPRPEHHGQTGLLTTKGFIAGKPGLPHFNYAAQVSMMFLGYIFEVPAEIVAQRDGFTPAGTTDPKSECYSCHKLLTPLAFQRSYWTDDGKYQTKNKDGSRIDATDRQLVDEYPFPGVGMEAFATQAVRKERFIRTIINTHYNFYFGRTMRFRTDERRLYKKLWENLQENNFKIRALIRALMTQPEYMVDG